MQERTGGNDLHSPSYSKGKEERRSLVERTVTIVRDESSGGGYGLTVSGDNPVFVQSIKQGTLGKRMKTFESTFFVCLGGSAWRAGVQSGDRILMVYSSPLYFRDVILVTMMLKVNDQYVARAGHIHVVQLIKGQF